MSEIFTDVQEPRSRLSQYLEPRTAAATLTAKVAFADSEGDSSWARNRLAAAAAIATRTTPEWLGNGQRSRPRRRRIESGDGLVGAAGALRDRAISVEPDLDTSRRT